MTSPLAMLAFGFVLALAFGVDLRYATGFRAGRFGLTPHWTPQ